MKINTYYKMGEPEDIMASLAQYNHADVPHTQQPRICYALRGLQKTAPLPWTAHPWSHLGGLRSSEFFSELF